MAFLRDAWSRGSIILDLHVVWDGEAWDLVVSCPLDREVPRDSKEILAGWAEAVRCRRIWFSDELRDLDFASADLASASTDCEACGAEWSDGSLRFWRTVHAVGAFPTNCPVCGCSMAQWQAETSEGDDANLCREESTHGGVS
jgi:hypothetical protein